MQDNDLDTTPPYDLFCEDLLTQLKVWKAQGIRLIIMMDANNDWDGKGGGKFKAFLDEVGLVDPLHKQFHNDGLIHTTYAWGSR